MVLAGLRRAITLLFVSVHVAATLVAAPALAVSALEAPSPRIDEARFVTVGGIEQWITIRGADRSSPVLLVLHGGPGEVQSPLVSTYAPLENDFVVVQWDQRGAGKTRARAGATGQGTSLEQLIRDGIALTEYIRDHLHATDVIVLGHSWGSFLGVHIVKQHPEYRYTLDRARAESNTTAVTELEALGLPASGRFDQYLAMRKWLNRYLAASDRQWLTTQDEMVRSVLSGEELKAYRDGFQTMTGLESTVFSMNLPPLGYDFKLPFFIIQGSEDHITPTSMAASYFEEIRAPKKGMTLIDGAGHFAVMTHTARFAAALREVVRLTSR